MNFLSRNKFGIFACTILLLTLFSVPTSTQATTDEPVGEYIKNYIVDAELQLNGDLHVTEYITYHFGDNAQDKHGIIRKIPLTRVVGSLDRTSISLDTIIDDESVDYNFYDESDSSTVKWKIGDADKTVTGTKQYNISYIVQNGLGYYKEFTELYFNYIGTEWVVPIHKVSIRLTLPDGLKQQGMKVYCGFEGQKEECLDVESSATSTLFTLKEGRSMLGAYEGVTIVTTFERGVIMSEPTLEELAALVQQEERQKMLINMVFLFPLIVPLFFLKRIKRIIRWKRYLRSHPIIAQYDAGGLTPVEASIFHNGYLDDKDFLADITYLLAHDYINIVEKSESGDGYNLTKKIVKGSRPIDDLREYQKEMVATLDGGNYVEIGKIFYEKINVIRKDLGNGLKNDGYVTSRPGMKRNSSSAPLWLPFFFIVNPGVFIWIGAIMLFGVDGIKFGISYTLFVIVLTIFIKIFKGKGRLALTESGMEKKWHIEGLFKYIDIAEKEKIKADADPEKNLEIVEKLLPYAIVFGMEGKWLKYLNYLIAESGNLSAGVQSRYVNTMTHYASVYTSASQILNSYSAHKTEVQRVSHSSSSSGFSSGSSGGGGGGGGGSSW